MNFRTGCNNIDLSSLVLECHTNKKTGLQSPVEQGNTRNELVARRSSARLHPNPCRGSSQVKQDKTASMRDMTSGVIGRRAWDDVALCAQPTNVGDEPTENRTNESSSKYGVQTPNQTYVERLAGRSGLRKSSNLIQVNNEENHHAHSHNISSYSSEAEQPLDFSNTGRAKFVIQSHTSRIVTSEYQPQHVRNATSANSSQNTMTHISTGGEILSNELSEDELCPPEGIKYHQEIRPTTQVLANEGLCPRMTNPNSCATSTSMANYLHCLDQAIYYKNDTNSPVASTNRFHLDGPAGSTSSTDAVQFRGSAVSTSSTDTVQFRGPTGSTSSKRTSTDTVQLGRQASAMSFSDFSVSFLLREENHEPRPRRVWADHNSFQVTQSAAEGRHANKHPRCATRDVCDSKMTGSALDSPYVNKLSAPAAEDLSDCKATDYSTNAQEKMLDTSHRAEELEDHEGSLRATSGDTSWEANTRQSERAEASNMHDMSASHKMARYKYTRDHLLYLTRQFLQNSYPSHDDLVAMSGNIGVPVRQLQVWFQNKRASTTGTRKPKSIRIYESQLGQSVYKGISCKSEAQTASPPHRLVLPVSNAGNCLPPYTWNTVHDAGNCLPHYTGNEVHHTGNSLPHYTGNEVHHAGNSLPHYTGNAAHHTGNSLPHYTCNAAHQEPHFPQGCSHTCNMASMNQLASRVRPSLRELQECVRCEARCLRPGLSASQKNPQVITDAARYNNYLSSVYGYAQRLQPVVQGVNSLAHLSPYLPVLGVQEVTNYWPLPYKEFIALVKSPDGKHRHAAVNQH